MVETSDAANNAVEKLEKAKRLRERRQEKYTIGIGKTLTHQTFLMICSRVYPFWPFIPLFMRLYIWYRFRGQVIVLQILTKG